MFPNDLTRHRASTSTRWHFAFGSVVIATKPMHQLQICPIVHNYRTPSTIPLSYIRVRAIVWECSERQTDPRPIYILPQLCLMWNVTRQHPCHSPKLHLGPCSSVGMRRRSDRQLWSIYTVFQKKTTTLFFGHNFGKWTPIFTFSVRFRRKFSTNLL